jgi:hypothetical protein
VSTTVAFTGLPSDSSDHFVFHASARENDAIFVGLGSALWYERVFRGEYRLVF